MKISTIAIKIKITSLIQEFASLIDYIIANSYIHSKNILDVKTLSFLDINSCHDLELGKLKIIIKKVNTTRPETADKLNIESFEEEGTETLYQNRLTAKERTDIETV